MSKSNATENDILSYLFNSTAFPAYGNTVYISLHTADPGEGGNQTTNETAYTSYDRVALTRADNTAWEVYQPGGVTTARNKVLISFPQCTGSPGDPITHVAIGTADHPSTGQILYSGPLNANLTLANLITPQFAINALVITED